VREGAFGAWCAGVCSVTVEGPVAGVRGGQAGSLASKQGEVGFEMIDMSVGQRIARRCHWTYPSGQQRP